jgi:hypothetical protein
MLEEKIQKNFIEAITLHDACDDKYFLTRTPLERLEAIEFMRKAMFGHDRVSARLQRILEIAELKKD